VIRYRYIEYAGEFGTEYRFQFAGEAIPGHSHRAGQGHAIRCLSGRVFLTGAVTQAIDPESGEILFDGTVPHTITALLPESVIFNRMETRLPNYLEMLNVEGTV
jgi:hypothetical protein